MDAVLQMLLSPEQNREAKSALLSAGYTAFDADQDVASHERHVQRE